MEGETSASRETIVSPHISIIVPIYNVEKYVRKCLESLVNQTMKQIEVICIDDGSTDASGAIADEYCNTDEDGIGESFPLIRVIHHGENRGLSAARNTGIDAAKSQWIMFVDSDDWVDERFCEIPYRVAVENQADMVIFRAYILKHGRIKKPKNEVTPIGLIDELTAHVFGGVVVWNKLYRKSLFDNTRYPEGRVHEDVATTHKFVHASKKVMRIQDCLYSHTIRKDSITYNHSSLNRQDNERAVMERNESLLSYTYSEDRNANLLCSTAISYLSRHASNVDKLYYRAIEIMDNVDEIPRDLTWKQKIAFLAWKIDKRLFFFLSRMIEKKHSQIVWN